MQPKVLGSKAPGGKAYRILEDDSNKIFEC